MNWPRGDAGAQAFIRLQIDVALWEETLLQAVEAYPHAKRMRRRAQRVARELRPYVAVRSHMGNIGDTLSAVANLVGAALETREAALDPLKTGVMILGKLRCDLAQSFKSR